jgi:glycosyltransferase involved in cell wall biosynthesis
MSEHRISLGIMTHNEVAELTYLLEVLKPHRHLFCEIVVVDDFSTPEMDAIFEAHNLKVYRRRLTGNFAAQRNFLLEHLSGDIALLLDPDETPGIRLLEELQKIATAMSSRNIDVVSVPRLNIHYDSASAPDPRSFKLDQHMLDTQTPDRQTRIIRLAKHLRYINKVHERIVGIKTMGMLPNRLEYAIVHAKSHQKQAQQNRLYGKIAVFAPNEIAKKLGLKRLAKRLGLIGNFREIELHGLA